MFILVLEISCRIYEAKRPSLDVDFTGGFGLYTRVFVNSMDNKGDKYELASSKSYSFNYTSFLKNKPLDTFRIFFLGESSVYNLQGLLKEFEFKIKKIIRKKINKVEIINVGANSYGSNRLLLVAHEIAKYSPDLVLAYIGHNEFEEVEQFHIINPRFDLLYYYISKLSMFRVFYSKYIEVEKKKLLNVYNRYPDFSSRDTANYSHASRDIIMKNFESNYNKIISGFTKFNIPVVIGTVPSNLLAPRFSDKQKKSLTEYYSLILKKDYNAIKLLSSNLLTESSNRHQSSSIENAIIKKLAIKYQLHLADVEAAIILNEPHHLPGEVLFKDHCHLNEAGNKILLDTFLDSIKLLNID